jgi:hypothetical protein
VLAAAAPGPLGGAVAQSGAHRVREDVGADAAQALLVADDARAEALLEEVSDAAVAAVESLRVHAVEPVHPVREPFE